MTRFLFNFAAAAVCLAASAGQLVAGNVETSARMNELANRRNGRLIEHRCNPRMARESRIADVSKIISSRRAVKKAPSIDPSMSFSGISSYDFLEGPDGSTWFYTSAFEYTERTVDGYTDHIIKSFRFDIYDSDYKLVGTVADEVRYGEAETRAAMVALDPAVTCKFFNLDDRPEVMVLMAMNTSEEFNYEMHYYNRVYSVGGAKAENGYDRQIAEMPGICIDAVNAARDAWSEDFFLSFQEDVMPATTSGYQSYLDYLADYRTRVTTYKKGGWGGEPVEVNAVEIPMLNMPGDQQNSVFMISKVVDGVPYFYFSQYEKSFFVDPTGFADDESATPDNTLLIDTYYLAGRNDKTLTHGGTTRIAATQIDSGDQLSYTFYGIGSLAYGLDVDTDVNGTPTAPAFIVTRDYVLAADIDNYLTSYIIYSAAGEPVATIAENTEGVVPLSDVAGHGPQAMFVSLDEKGFTFNFTDLYSGRVQLSLPQMVEGEYVQAAVDRVPDGRGGYQYAMLMSYNAEDNQGNTYPRIAWIDADGNLIRIDKINAGQNVARSTVNISADVLSPYLFDTDEDMEYMMLVGRYTGESTTVAEELDIADARDGAILFTAAADSRGALRSINILQGTETSPARLQIIRYDYDNYAVENFDLPFTRFAGGDGTPANPYLIASVGDLQQIKIAPAASYALAGDIDAHGFDFTAIPSFSGRLDGCGHSVSNLNIGDHAYNNGIFAMMTEGASVSNLTLIDVNLTLGGNSAYAGVIAGRSSNAVIDNVHVYALSASGPAFDGTMGGLVGQTSVYTAVTNSGVVGTIDLPAASGVGGIAGTALTGSRLAADSFTGSITAATAVGGIAGETNTGDETIADCHVDADLTAQNNVGGIIGSSTRSIVTRCYVEGSIAATTPDKWLHSLAAGGVVGSMLGDYGNAKTESGTSTGAPATVISDNVVALRSIAGEGLDGLAEQWPGQLSTVHRVLGKSIVNDAPEITGYDADDNPVYSDKLNDPEGALARNYVLATLPVVDDAVVAGAATTEGESIDAITREMLAETLGFGFGESADTPWHAFSDSDPWLHHESAFILASTAYEVTEGDTFAIRVRFLNREPLTVDDAMDSFMLEMDESLLEMTGNGSIDNNVLSVELRALAAGSGTVAVTIGSQTQTASVTVVQANSGIDNVVAAAVPVITRNGDMLEAQGCGIELYNASGTRVAAGRDRLSLHHLAPGIYIAVATDRAARRATLKLTR